MTPLEVVRQAEGMRLTDEEGHASTLELLPPLSAQELRTLEASLPCPLPQEARDLFAYCRGLEGVLESVDFSGVEGGFGLEEVFPHPVAVAHDGFGNYWVVDLVSTSTSWGPVLFACHDAPVIVFQTDSFAHFLSELLRLGNAPWQGELDAVHEQYTSRIWSDNPGVLPHSHCLTCGDPDLETFARSLDGTWEFIDLRQPKLGDGFSWGRYGGRPEGLRRFGEKRIFACQKRKSFWQRVMGR